MERTGYRRQKAAIVPAGAEGNGAAVQKRLGSGWSSLEASPSRRARMCPSGKTRNGDTTDNLCAAINWTSAETHANAAAQMQRIEVYLRTNVMAFSGQELTHSPQASHNSGRTRIACCQRWTNPLILPWMVKPVRRSVGSVSTAKTVTGHTRTQSALPSQRLRSMTGENAPGACLHSGGLDNAVLQDDFGNMYLRREETGVVCGKRQLLAVLPFDSNIYFLPVAALFLAGDGLDFCCAKVGSSSSRNTKIRRLARSTSTV